MVFGKSLPVPELMIISNIQFVQMIRHVCLCWTKKTGFFIINVGAIRDDGELLSKGVGCPFQPNYSVSLKTMCWRLLNWTIDFKT